VQHFKIISLIIMSIFSNPDIFIKFGSGLKEVVVPTCKFKPCN